MNHLAYRLSLSSKISFYEVYSICDPDILAMIPRRVFALLITPHMTGAWKQIRNSEDVRRP